MVLAKENRPPAGCRQAGVLEKLIQSCNVFSLSGIQSPQKNLRTGTTRFTEYGEHTYPQYYCIRRRIKIGSFAYGLENIPAPAIPKPANNDPKQSAGNATRPMIRMRITIKHKPGHQIARKPQSNDPQIDDKWPFFLFLYLCLRGGF
jgi:hypothetical protein